MTSEATSQTDLSVWLADLTYTQQSVAADTIPMAIGCIATYAESKIQFESPIRLFKYPEKLSEALDSGPLPDVIGFSNYCWNTELSSSFAKLIKRHSPGTVVVFGGPHYPLEPKDQQEFLKTQPYIDFYIVKEGEIAFSNLIAAITDTRGALEQVKHREILSVHTTTSNGAAILTDFEKRLLELDDIPSPYTSGRLNEFFDGQLMPLIQTNRGCPFSCTFCVEGLEYYSKVRRYSSKRVKFDIAYIGQKMDEAKSFRKRNDLFIADSNFGMYSGDHETCYALKDTRDKYGWPEYINVATGKNKKERVLEAAAIIDGALRLSGSVQSLDENVLDNVKRKNISSDQLIDLGLAAEKAGVNSYSEIILGLPGDSKQAHFSTIKKVMDAGFNIILPWQLMLLPGSELETKDTRTKFGFQTKYRVLPRCFGNYRSLGENVIAAEIEEICVSSNTLSYEDYIDCRKFNLLLVIFYNDGIFSALVKLFRQLDISPFRWLELMMSLPMPNSLVELIDEFLKDTHGELWDQKNDLLDFTQETGVIQQYIDGEIGNNLLYVYRTRAITEHLDSLKDLARHAASCTLEEAGKNDVATMEFIDNALMYQSMRLCNIFHKRNDVPRAKLNYDLIGFEKERTPKKFGEYKFETPKMFDFVLDQEQEDLISRYLSTFGSSTTGIARIVSRVYVKKLYRKPVPVIAKDETLPA